MLGRLVARCPSLLRSSWHVRARSVLLAAGGAMTTSLVADQMPFGPLHSLPALCKAAPDQEEACVGQPIVPPKLDDPEYNAQVMTSWKNKIQEAREQFARLDVAGAERTLELALEEAGHFGQASGPVATSLLNLAQLYRRAGRLDEAQPLLDRAADVLDQTAGPNNKVTLLALIDLAAVKFERGDVGGSINGYRDVLSRIDAAMETQKHAALPLSSVRAACVFSMAKGLIRNGDYEEAESQLLVTLSLLETRWGASSAKLLAPCAELARLLTHQGRGEEGQQFLQRAQALSDLKPVQREQIAKLAAELKL